jgi:pimeloyl-ACP methyl ester carboxylesterase
MALQTSSVSGGIDYRCFANPQHPAPEQAIRNRGHLVTIRPLEQEIGGLTMTKSRIAVFVCLAQLAAGVAFAAGGEAGPISLRDQGFFWAGARTTPLQAGRTGFGPPGPGTAIEGQMYVGFQLVANKRHPYPLVLVHGGGGQATDWMGTPDGRDGWLDYFLAAGYDVYFVDRPAHGRSPNVRTYGALGEQPTTEFIANVFTIQSRQYPGGGAANTKEVIQHTASSEPGPTVSNKVLQENLAELLDRIGPAIVVTHSAGGPSGWLAMAARPDKVKGVLAIEPAMGITDNLAPLIRFQPALAEGQKIALEEQPAEGPGLNKCQLQPKASVHTVPAFAGKPVLFVVAPNSSPMFTPSVHCSVHTLNQLGASAKLARLEAFGLQGNGHFMNEELNNGEIAKKVFIPFLDSIK